MLSPKHEQEPLALVGIGCRFPGGGRDAESFWNLMASGTSAISEVPADRWNADRFYHPDPLASERMVTKWGGFVDHLKNFDAAFWGISPREAMRMDPQQRWLLEAAWEAIEDAGIPPASLRGTTTGVFVGISAADYLTLQLSDKNHIDVHTNSGGTLSIAANRVSYMLDLRGPSVSVDTACSSALVAVSFACRAIWSGECEGALAGGANALISPNSSIGFSKAGMLSPSGQCFAFDERANGYVRGEGAGLVYLKPLSQAQRDGDRIYAVIRSAVVNSDGHTSSMTVPGVESQAAMLRQAYREAGIRPQDVDYIEAHGTGTQVGDPIESEALGRVLGEGRADDNKCLMGSVKTNIGHLESGSGIAGMIKAALVLHHRMVPPNQNFKTPNPNIPFDSLRLEVVKELRPLPQPEDRLPVASVNSFGFGGTNAHVVMEAAPLPAGQTQLAECEPKATRPFVLPISARDKSALRDYAAAYCSLLSDMASEGRQSPDTATVFNPRAAPPGSPLIRSPILADFCYSAGTHKDHHSERLVVIADDAQQMTDRLQSWLDGEESVPGAIVGQRRDPKKELVFVFTGQGSQWWAMGQQLLQREPLFRGTIEKMDTLFQKLSGWSIVEEMLKSEDQSSIDRTSIAQPAICALQIALVELWKSWGITPTRVVGHSVGEVAAAYCAGALSLEDTVCVIYHRSRLQDTTAGHGRMLAAGITPREARDMIGELADQVHITAINSPGLVTLGGDTAPLELIGERLEREGRFMRWLKVNYAFHTHQMDPIRQQLLESLGSIKPQAGSIPFVSTVTGSVYPGEQLDANYWWHNVRRPVLFEPAIAKSIQAEATVFLEVGPHPSMQSSLNDSLAAQRTAGCVFHSLSRKTDESLQMLSNLAQLHFSGVKIDWSAVNQSVGQLVRLPSYPWHYEAYWLDQGDLASRLLPIRHQFLQRRLAAARPTWQFDADLRIFSYLQDHRLWDGVVFPAAGFAEVGLAIARELFPEEPYGVEELELLKALFVSQDAVPTIQVTFDPDERTFRIFSRADEKQDWELHASGRLVLVSSEIPFMDAVDLAEIRARIGREVTHEQVYAELGLMGYQFGPVFSQIEKVWCVPGESLAKIVAPLSIIESASGYRFHPAILDACFQATHGTREVRAEMIVPDFFFLPESIRRVQLYQTSIPQELWAHAKLRQRDAKSFLCDIFVYDVNGNRVADVLGFRAAQIEHKRSSDGTETGLYQFRWEELPLPAATSETKSVTVDGTVTVDRDTCLVFADKRGVADLLIAEITRRGQTAIKLRPGKKFRQLSETEFLIPPDSADDLRRVIERCLTHGGNLTSVIHCWSLDHVAARQIKYESLQEAQQTGVLSALQLAQVLRSQETPESPAVFFVSRGAQMAIDNDPTNGLASSPLIGFLRVANNELPQFRWTLIDLDHKPDTTEIDALLNEITIRSGEREVALRKSLRFVNRLRPVLEDDLTLRSRNAVEANGNITPYRLQTGKPGVLTRLSLNETHRTDPQAEEIEVRVMAGGINFRDLMKAMGMYPGNPLDLLWFGDDFSGVVERVGKNVKDLSPGDRVTGLAPYSFRSFVTVHRRKVFSLPKRMSFSDAATLPTVFLTAHYALNELARMQKGESILIHAGTGGVGMAAIQVAQRLGLEIFATAGSGEKRTMLRNLGVPHVLNSRTLEFADQIMEITDGRGVDAVLNSLAREFIPKSLSILAPFGRFLEIGKIDVYGNTRVRLNALKDNISCFVIDLAQHLSAKPDYVASMFDELALRFAAGDYRPLPSKVFPISEVVDAFRYMAQGKHVGKNVLSFTGKEIPVAPCSEEGHLLKADATYLITGGAGGFGWNIAKWMVSEGARNLALMSRTGPRAEIAADLEKLKASGVRVMDLRADVTDPEDVGAAIAEIRRQLPPLRGVVHAAMVLDDTFIHELDAERFNSVLNPKMLGGWNLHLATADLPLDHFICFSSVSALIGTTKQSNYGAANCFLDALASYRHSLGLPALTVNWGAIGGSGYLERNLKAKEYLDKLGFRSLLVPDAVRALRELMQRSAPQICVAKADWEQLARFSPALGSLPMYTPLFREKSSHRSGGAVSTRVCAAAPGEQAAVVEEFLAEQVACVFGIEASQVDRNTPLTHLGLDSLMAVELMNRLESELHLSIPMGSVLSGPNVQQLANTLLTLVLANAAAGDALLDVRATGSPTKSPAENSEVRVAEFWIEQLEHAPVGLQWPSGSLNQQQRADSGSVLPWTLSFETFLQLMAFSAELNLQVSDILFAAWQLTLHRFCNQPDLLIGYEFDDQALAEQRTVGGESSNCLPLRSILEPGVTYGRFLATSNERLAAARRHQLPFSQLSHLVEWPEGSNDKSSLQATFSAVDLPACDDHCDSQISLWISVARGQISGEWRFNPDVLDAASVAQINAIYHELLQQIVAHSTHQVPFSAVRDTSDFVRGNGHSSSSRYRLPRIRRAAPAVPEDVAADLVLDPEIVPSGSTPICSTAMAKRILLTGTTGFLGAYLLDELLHRTDAEIICLVRASDEAAGRRRLTKNLKRYSLTPPDIDERVRVVVGDFSKPAFGLSPELYQQLAAEVDVIYHNGADFNLALSYAALRATNVGGVIESLKLAVATRTKPVHLVSTFAVHTTAENRGQLVTEEDPIQPFEKQLYGYTQTKWVGEKLVLEARQRGIPVTMYRPGHITGDSITGASNTNDLLHTLVIICLRLGAAPLRDVELDVTPVDYVAKALVELSFQPQSANRDFHLTNPIPMRTQALNEWMRLANLELEMVSYDVWRDRLLKMGNDMGIGDIRMLTDVLGPRALGDDDSRAVHPRFDSNRTQSSLVDSAISCPVPSTSLFDTYLEFMRRTGLVDTAKSFSRKEVATGADRATRNRLQHSGSSDLG
jgi:thioester reductase-like protein